MATRDGIFLDMAGVEHDDVRAGIMGSITLTVRTSIVKYLRGGTRVASPTKLKTSRTLAKKMRESKPKRTYADATPIHNIGLSGALAKYESQTSLNSGPNSGISDSSGRHFMPASTVLMLSSAKVRKQSEGSLYLCAMRLFPVFLNSAIAAEMRNTIGASL